MKAKDTQDWVFTNEHCKPRGICRIQNVQIGVHWGRANGSSLALATIDYFRGLRWRASFSTRTLPIGSNQNITIRSTRKFRSLCSLNFACASSVRFFRARTLPLISSWIRTGFAIDFLLDQNGLCQYILGERYCHVELRTLFPFGSEWALPTCFAGSEWALLTCFVGSEWTLLCFVHKKT